jgi:hypothetical protein
VRVSQGLDEAALTRKGNKRTVNNTDKRWFTWILRMLPVKIRNFDPKTMQTHDSSNLSVAAYWNTSGHKGLAYGGYTTYVGSDRLG